jgi:hypothetical protein
MTRFIGSTIIAIGIVWAPVIFAGIPGDEAFSQTRAVKGDRLDIKPPRMETPIRIVGPSRYA